MFVSIRDEISLLLSENFSLNEIAHRLGVARSTVGYHVEVLRGDRNDLRRSQQNFGERRGITCTAPMAPPEATRTRVQRLLQMGHSRIKVAEMLGLSRSTVTYHAARLGVDIDGRCARRYDWQAIRDFYEAGHSVAECKARFGFNKQSWHAAIRRGVITARPARMPLEQLLVAGTRRSRGHLKARLFDAGIKTRRCELCGLSRWNELPIPLALHHINGDRHDNRLENLQILCANCHGQTDTWAGRNNRTTPKNFESGSKPAPTIPRR